jgi:cytochrome c
MKQLVIVSLLGGALLMANAAFANIDLARQKNCMACHSMNNKVVGPSFKDISKRYSGQKGAEDQLVQAVLKGGSGKWGAVPMPANGQVSEAEARALVKWVLSQK